MDVVAKWTGRHAALLQQALRLTNEGFAAYLGVHVRTVAFWRKRPGSVPLPETQQILDAALAKAGDREKQQFRALLEEPGKESSIRRDETSDRELDIEGLNTWIKESDTSDSAIDALAHGAVKLAEEHTQRPALEVFSDVMSLHKQVQDMLRTRTQRLAQMRELYRIESDLLAHGCLLLGDLNQNDKAVRYGQTALLCAKESGGNQAKAWTVQAKTTRWQGKYTQSAELARRGYECSPLAPVRVQLAYQEANAAALLGDADRAHRALRRAEEAAEADFPDDTGVSAWSFPLARQAVFALSIATYLGNPENALRAAATADACWAAGDPKVAGTWAQVRVGAGMAHLLNDELDGAADEVAPVLQLPPELRMGTVTGYTTNLDRRLDEPRFKRSPIAVRLREQIAEFHSAALPKAQAMEEP